MTINFPQGSEHPHGAPPMTTEHPLKLSQVVDEVMENSSKQAEPVLVEAATRLSKSTLWKIQEDYYSSQGIAAWNQYNVPFFVTNSTFIAETYADMILAFLQDCLPYLDIEEPIYIIEMASGSGRFSHYIIKELTKKLGYFSALKQVKLRYIMTDFTEKNIAFWETHEKFQPFIQSGLLDFAVFRPERFQALNLRIAKQELTSRAVKNPVIAIANYFFDTIRQDAFRVASNTLQEARVALFRDPESASPTGHLHISQIQTVHSYNTVNDNYYDNPKLNEILRYYRTNLTQGSVIFPIGAFNCIQNLQVLSNNNLVILSSDKGFTDLAFMQGHWDQSYAIHDGAFSYMVNYDAIGRYFENSGGKAFFSSDKTLTLQTVFFIEQARPECAFEHLRYLFEERLNRQNPINFLFEVQDLLSLVELTDSRVQKMDSLLAFVRLSLCEPAAFCQCAPMIAEGMEYITENQRMDLIKIMETVWDNYYFFPGESNLPFWLGQTYFAVGLYEKSLEFLQKTIELFGPHEALYFLMARNQENLDNPDAAKECYQKALELRPDFEEAKESLAQLTES